MFPRCIELHSIERGVTETATEPVIKVRFHLLICTPRVSLPLESVCKHKRWWPPASPIVTACYPLDVLDGLLDDQPGLIDLLGR